MKVRISQFSHGRQGACHTAGVINAPVEKQLLTIPEISGCCTPRLVEKELWLFEDYVVRDVPSNPCILLPSDANHEVKRLLRAYPLDDCDGKTVEIDGKKYQLKLVE